MKAAMQALASLRARLMRRPVLTFYLLTFGLEYGLVGVLTALGKGLPLSIVTIALYLPMAVAVLLSALESGWAGVRALLGKFGVWRVGIQWYLFVLLSPAALAVVARALYTSTGASVAPIQSMAVGTLFAHAIGTPVGEEPGWRGFALPRLQSRMSALSASLVIGVLWGVIWHLPMFLAGLFTVQLVWYVALVMAWAILFTWVYNHTRGSLLLAFLYHWAINVSANVIPFGQGNLLILYVVLSWALALAVVVFGPRRRVREPLPPGTSVAGATAPQASR